MDINKASNSEKRDFIGGLIASVLVKNGVEKIIDHALDKVAADKSVPMSKEAVPEATEKVMDDLQADLQARAEHKLDIEPVLSSRNVLGVITGLVGEAFILYTFWTDNIPQDFQADVIPHLLVIGGLLTPLYSRFIAKKPLFR